MTDTRSAEAGPRRAPATVVIGLRVKAGRADDYREWQLAVNAAAAAFDGFLGVETMASGDDRGDWTVVYRFASVDQLQAWLDSATRTEMLRAGADLFDHEASQQVLVGTGNEQVATVVVSHPVDPADEVEFLAWQRRITDAEREFPGFSGSELFRPVPGVQENWTAVYRFASAADLDRWLASDERQALLQEGSKFRDFELRKINRSFGSWFSFGGDGAGAPAPPSWKTALSVLVGLYPTVVLLTLGITELWRAGPLWATLLLGNALSVVLLTWVVMPVVTRALHFWLEPSPGAPEPRTDLLGVVTSVSALTLAAFVFWLVTVQLWTLP